MPEVINYFHARAVNGFAATEFAVVFATADNHRAAGFRKPVTAQKRCAASAIAQNIVDLVNKRLFDVVAAAPQVADMRKPLAGEFVLTDQFTQHSRHNQPQTDV